MLAARRRLRSAPAPGGAPLARLDRRRPEGPAGLRATVYATGLAHVSAFALDAQGRLWVTTSAAANHAADGVWLVRRAGATPVEVISGLKGPLGLVWSDGTLYVASIGQVDAYANLSGTRFARHRRVLTETSGHG